jgi:hypothetical protein
MATNFGAPRLRVLSLLLAGIFFIGTLRLFTDPLSHHHPLLSLSHRAGTTVRRNIAVASRFPFHFDVYMTVVWTLDRIMKEGKVHVYSDGPFRFDFQTISESYGLFNGELKHQANFLDEMREDDSIDLVILGTCEVE